MKTHDSDTKETYSRCLQRMKEIAALGAAAGLLGWDQETMMPKRASKARAEQSAALAGVIHERFIHPSIGEMLRQLADSPSDLAADHWVNVREWLHDYEKATRLPTELVKELAKTATLSQRAWITAREKSDFGIFSPWLKKMIGLKQRQAEAYGYEDIPYDALLDDYERGMTDKLLRPVIEEVRKGLVPMVAAIGESKLRPDVSFLARSYPEPKQEELCRELMAAMGVDEKASRLDRSVHPFCCGLDPTDVRITTRYNKKWLPQALYGVMHESGHALYEQGLEEKHSGTPLGEAVSLGIHESQSRLWENMIGRSRPFVSYIFPRLKKRFPTSLRGVGPEGFYRAINRVVPSPIRVEADEVTYNLHIALRYEIEKGFIAGEVRVDELPELWIEKMKRYLGIRPKNDAEGVLQDTHWAQGLVGYFPTYLLGNLYAAQWWHKLSKDIRVAEKKISRGEFGPILDWLRRNIHRHGRRYNAMELVERVTGRPLGASYFLNYLKKKYGRIYGVKW